MAEIWEPLLGAARPFGAVPTILAVFCLYLMIQLERERRERGKERDDILALLDRMLARLK